MNRLRQGSTAQEAFSNLVIKGSNSRFNDSNDMYTCMAVTTLVGQSPTSHGKAGGWVTSLYPDLGPPYFTEQTGPDQTGPDPDPNPRNGPEWRGTHVRSSRPPEFALKAIMHIQY